MILMSLPASNFTLDLRSDKKTLILPPQRERLEPASRSIKALISLQNTFIFFLAFRFTMASMSIQKRLMFLLESNLTMAFTSLPKILIFLPA